MVFRPVLLVLLITLPAFPIAAQTALSWNVVEAGGMAQFREGSGPWRDLQRGAMVQPRTQVRTGAAGRGVLSRSGNTITVNRQSNLQIADPGSGITAQILQTLGTLLFRVENGPDRNFSVDTPYLSATVKGTVFSVTVNA